MDTNFLSGEVSLGRFSNFLSSDSDDSAVLFGGGSQFMEAEERTSSSGFL